MSDEAPERGVGTQLARRRFMQVTALVAGQALIACGRAKRLSGPLVVGSRGGYIGQAEKETIWDPFSEKYGVEVIQCEAPSTDDIVKAQVEARKVQISFTWTTDRGYRTMVEKGYLEKIDYSKFSPNARRVVDSMPQGTVRDHGIAISTIGVNLGYDKRRFPEGGPQPRTWEDFWDTRTFPGPRSLINQPYFSLEAALLADGVDPGKLYPLDVERGFRKLAQIKGSIVKWWAAGAQPAQLLTDGEAALAMAYNGRLDTAVEEGATVDYSWDGALTYYDYGIVLKGAPNLETVWALLSLYFEPEVATAISEKTRYPIPSPILWQAASKDKRDRWPSAPQNVSKLVKMEFLWWAEPYPGDGGKTNLEVLTERFNSFIAS